MEDEKSAGRMLRMLNVLVVFAFFCSIEYVQGYRTSIARPLLANNQLFGGQSSRSLNRFEFKGEAPSSSALHMSATSGSKRKALKSLAAVCKNYMKSIIFGIKDMFDRLFSSLSPPAFSMGGASSEAKALRSYREDLIAKKLAAEKLKEENRAKAIAAMQNQPPAAITMMSNEPVIAPPAERAVAPVVASVKAAPTVTPVSAAVVAPPKVILPAGKAAYDAKIKAKKSYSPF